MIFHCTFFSAKKVHKKTRRFGYLRGWDSTKDEFLQASNIRMRPCVLKGGMVQMYSVLFLLYLKKETKTDRRELRNTKK